MCSFYAITAICIRLALMRKMTIAKRFKNLNRVVGTSIISAIMFECWLSYLWKGGRYLDTIKGKYVQSHR